MTELSLLVSVENNLATLLVWKNRTCRNKVMSCLNFENLPLFLIPNKNLCVLYPLISLAEVVFKVGFALSFLKITFQFFLFNLSHINPPILIRAEPGDTKNIILQKLIMFSFDCNGIKTCNFLDSAFLVVLKFLWNGLYFIGNVNILNG